MKVKLWLSSVVLSFAIGVTGGHFQAERQSGAPVALTTSSLASLNELPKLALNSSNSVYEIKTTSSSYFARDGKGGLIPEIRDGKKYYKSGEAVYHFARSIDTAKTALIIMDPWEDSGSPFLNRYYEPIIREHLLPLINKSITLDIPVIVLTNAPSENTDYGNKVHPEIEKLAKSGKIHIVYHQDTDSSGFSKWLRSMSIDTLIYSGFASNMCVIGRDLGMIPMQIKGFRLFFVPEASAAIEFEGSWKTGAIHESTTLLISQWIGELIAITDFLSLPETSTK